MKLKLCFLTLFFGLSCIHPLWAQDVFDAARTGNLASIKLLVKLKSDTVSRTNQNGFTPLILACYYGQKNIVEFLLNEGVDLETNSPEGTALLAAVYKGNLEIVSLFLLHNINLNATNDEGTTPLMFAAMAGNFEMVNLLLTHGADKNKLSKYGHTALTLAQKYAFKEIEVLLSKN